jgi:BirA family transcriptional regulator, biotin operon repressor / biotin---[acetyl-CoA-carboxylase] ligase
MRLDPAAVAAGVRLATYDVIESTNADALARAQAGERGPLWIVAGRQTAGRGRHGRGWISEPGNLYATLLLSDPGPAARAPELAFVAGLAVYDAVTEAVPALQQRLMLKWPNDLLCDGAKLAGILIEGEGAVVAVGIGINCKHHPDDTAYPATDLLARGAAVTPNDLLPLLSKTMLARLAQWQSGTGFAVIRANWLARAGANGSAIAVRFAAREIVGRYEGIDGSGRLLLRTPDGKAEMISAGEVFLLAPLNSAATD